MSGPEVLHKHGINVHDILSVVAIVALGIGWWNSESRSNTTTTTNLANLTETVKTLGFNQGLLTKHLEEVDQKGTQASQAANRLMDERNTEQDRRLNLIEGQLITVVPDLREIRTKLNFVADLIDGQSKGHR